MGGGCNMTFDEFITKNFKLQVAHKIDIAYVVTNVKLHETLITFDMNIFRYIYGTDPRLDGQCGAIRVTVEYEKDRFLIDEETNRAMIDMENDLEWLNQKELIDAKILRKIK